MGIALLPSQGRPLLVEGAAGSGKTAMIEAAAAATGNHDRLVLHLDDQADSKSLLGQYVCGPAPGQFRWQVRANHHPPSPFVVVVVVVVVGWLARFSLDRPHHAASAP